MNRFPDFQTDLIFSDKPPAETPEKEAPKADAPAENGSGPVKTQATTEQPTPLAPQVTGVLEPISGAQIFVLVMFGVISAVMVIAMTRYGSDKNYGD